MGIGVVSSSPLCRPDAGHVRGSVGADGDRCSSARVVASCAI